MSFWINLSAVARVCVVGLLVGAGLPALFAIGLRALAPAGAGDGDLPGSHAQGRLPPRRVASIALAVVCFLIILVCAACGITVLVRG
ncbi:hypothetical protein [Lapillicoccus sp.]|uniref:hypothetical protein n=1 Tax=Lapillicoccus sp. TaxID=1909287 RepID=UPI00326450FA